MRAVDEALLRGPDTIEGPAPAGVAPGQAPLRATVPAPTRDEHVAQESRAKATAPIEDLQAETLTEPLPSDPRAGAEAAALRAFDAEDTTVDLLAPAARPAEPDPSDEPPQGQTMATQPPGRSEAEARASAEHSAAAPTTASQAFAGALDAGIDWHSCRIIEPRLAPTTVYDDDVRDAPILVTADAAVLEISPEIAHFSGDVQLIQGSLELQAAELTVDRGRGEAQATGGVLIANPDLRVAGSSATYRLGPRTGEVTQASYRLPATHARGDASEAALLGDGKSRYADITYTTCSPTSDDWVLRADTLELDHEEGLGTAKDATLRFFGVPLLYAPTFTFPIDDRRRSGVLPPSVGNSDSTGFDISVPYYLNLAPNFDLTLVPRVMSKRGVMLGGEFRFLTEDADGVLAAEFLPDDREYPGEDSRRGRALLNAIARFNDLTTAELRLNYVSDDDYFQDLGDSIAVSSRTNVERTGELRYRGDRWDVLARAQYYQTLDAELTLEERPYSRLPQVRVDLAQAQGPGGTALQFDAEYVYFHRSDSVRGHRLDLFPAVRLPLDSQWWRLEPKLGARYTGYRLSDVNPGDNDSPDELSGLFSLDGGLLFDRSTVYFDTAATHTLEPRLYYLLVPTGRQEDQPIFDTDRLNFGFENLFRENRFSGADRFGDANQLTLALTSRVLGASSGEELLRASIGQIYYFDTREVTLPGEPAEDDDSSVLVTEIDAALGGNWRSRAGLQWDPHDGDDGTIDQAVAQLTYRDSRRDRVFHAAYRLREGVTNQTDLAAIWPLTEQMKLIGRHYYSLRENRLLETLAGFEYGRCCWRLRAVARQFANTGSDKLNLGFLLQLELTGLGQLGNDIDTTLGQTIYGYR